MCEEILRQKWENPEIQCMDDLEKELEQISKESRTAKLWVDVVVRPVLLIFQFIRASRERDFLLHIYCVENMLVYVFAVHKPNYSRYGLYYVRSLHWADIQILERFSVPPNSNLQFSLRESGFLEHISRFLNQHTSEFLKWFEVGIKHLEMGFKNPGSLQEN